MKKNLHPESDVASDQLYSGGQPKSEPTDSLQSSSQQPINNLPNDFSDKSTQPLNRIEKDSGIALEKLPYPSRPEQDNDINVGSPDGDTSTWPRSEPFNPNILIMKGGGVKGLAFVGALEILESYNYKFTHFVGTSAGAISAALLAAGYDSKGLKDILEKTDFRAFKDRSFLPALLSLLFYQGLYPGNKFRDWLDAYLEKKIPFGPQPVPFQSLDKDRRLTVFASRRGVRSYYFDSKNPTDRAKEISFACRCSMAIPYFFTPERSDGYWLVDGGIRNNYPVYALLENFSGLKDASDFVGLYLGPKVAKRSAKWVLLDIFSIWKDSGSEEARKKFSDRTIVIDPRPIRTTDFSLSDRDKEFLLAEGKASALRWLYKYSDRGRPTVREVEGMEQLAAVLRERAINERWSRLWPKLAIAITFIYLLQMYSS